MLGRDLLADDLYKVHELDLVHRLPILLPAEHAVLLGDRCADGRRLDVQPLVVEVDGFVAVTPGSSQNGRLSEHTFVHPDEASAALTSINDLLREALHADGQTGSLLWSQDLSKANLLHPDPVVPVDPVQLAASDPHITELHVEDGCPLLE